MKRDWYLDVVFPALARMPTTLPWWLAGRVGDQPRPEQGRRREWLRQCFARVFPEAGAAAHAAWARAHLDMLAQERVDGLAFARLGQPGGPTVEMEGAELAEALVRRGQGFILVLTHFDRLMTPLIALARRGVTVHAVTMPIASNEELGAAHGTEVHVLAGVDRDLLEEVDRLDVLGAV